jgi:hypothetical protein
MSNDERTRILGVAARFGLRKVTIDGLGEVFIRPAKVKFLASLGDVESQSGRMLAGARMICHCICDSEGNQVLKDEDAEEVLSWPGSLYKAVSEITQKASGLEDKVGDAAKNLPTTP